MYNIPLRRRSLLRGWGIAITAVAALVASLVIWGNQMRSQEAQDRAAMANTKIVYAADPVLRLAQRADGSYYRATTFSEYSSDISFDFTTVQDQGVVVPGTVTTQEQRPTGFLWYQKTLANDITVRIIDPHEADRTPRLERLRCTVQPIDPSKPSYTGDPHDRSRLKIGPDQEGTDAGSLSGLFSNGGQQLCQDRITILVPDGSIQP
ncbi:hypothetical protein ACOT81_38650 [Streptomyces sp. WI04-05B]|uniref:Uncharacterized protein n=1 Tax=Streptomyces turgidiscabies (strain Car8) TaxID=698760 RepID=L7F493_STRT8|nr:MULTISPECIES: hypothetical protein [Streptomyces]ELP66102.1 hypothetical protein STRTUCAR8_01575 [Streptomyces turgidiscabies Car8]MDX2547520.1 hypothetical protein [Streptomyces sp. WI04-05B]MDX2589913.1 hypothetical protein [Streptomyces sp. WI04-05A]MDX3499786.1 hypothetical protein [Streptomyces turgidiscabies]